MAGTVMEFPSASLVASGRCLNGWCNQPGSPTGMCETCERVMIRSMIRGGWTVDAAVDATPEQLLPELQGWVPSMTLAHARCFRLALIAEFHPLLRDFPAARVGDEPRNRGRRAAFFGSLPRTNVGVAERPTSLRSMRAVTVVALSLCAAVTLGQVALFVLHVMGRLR